MNQDKDHQHACEAPVERKGRYRFSANRGDARHRVRYVESGGGEANENCKICQPMLSPRPDSAHK